MQRAALLLKMDHLKFGTVVQLYQRSIYGQFWYFGGLHKMLCV